MNRLPSFEVVKVAKRFGICIRLVDDCYTDRCCTRASTVLTGVSTCLYHREIHIRRDARGRKPIGKPSQFPNPEVLLHEMLHIVLAVPWYAAVAKLPYISARMLENCETWKDALWSIGNQPLESKFFLGIERVWARALMPSKYWYRQACAFQQAVAVTGEAMLGEIPRTQQLKVINRGKRIGQKIGIVDHNNRPIFRWPDWSKIDFTKDLNLERSG